jgi:hypothetical protein
MSASPAHGGEEPLFSTIPHFSPHVDTIGIQHPTCQAFLKVNYGKKSLCDSNLACSLEKQSMLIFVIISKSSA